MAGTEIRRATTSDAAVVGALLHDFNVEFETATPSAEDFAARFAHLLGRDDVVVLLAGDDPPLGFAYLTLRPTPYFEGPLSQLEELYVRPDRRDQGIGTALLAEAMASCRRLGSEEMHINVDEDDVDTRRFYERHGFANQAPGSPWRMLFYERAL